MPVAMYCFSYSYEHELFDAANELLALVHVGGRPNLCLALRRLIDLREIEERSYLRMQQFFYMGQHGECIDDVLPLDAPMQLLDDQRSVLDALDKAQVAILAELLVEYPGAGGEAKTHIATAYPQLSWCSIMSI